MPPKQSVADPVLEMLTTLQKSVDSINDKLTVMTTKLDTVSDKVQAHDDQLNVLSETVNGLEQRGRMNSLRISGLPIPTHAAGCPIKTCTEVYNRVLKPILVEAVRNGDIASVPDCLQLIEYGHTLPGKKGDAPNIIIRLSSRIFKLCIFKNKRKVLTGNASMQGIYLNEDLTAINRRRLVETKSNPATQSAWTVNGKIKYTLKDSPSTVRTWSPKHPGGSN